MFLLLLLRTECRRYRSGSESSSSAQRPACCSGAIAPVPVGGAEILPVRRRNRGQGPPVAPGPHQPVSMERNPGSSRAPTAHSAIQHLRAIPQRLKQLVGFLLFSSSAIRPSSRWNESGGDGVALLGTVLMGRCRADLLLSGEQMGLSRSNPIC